MNKLLTTPNTDRQSFLYDITFFLLVSLRISQNYRCNYSDKMSMVPVLLKSERWIICSTVLRAYKSVLLAFLGGRNVFLMHSNTDVCFSDHVEKWMFGVWMAQVVTKLWKHAGHFISDIKSCIKGPKKQKKNILELDKCHNATQFL